MGVLISNQSDKEIQKLSGRSEKSDGIIFYDSLSKLLNKTKRAMALLFVLLPKLKVLSKAFITNEQLPVNNYSS